MSLDSTGNPYTAYLSDLEDMLFTDVPDRDEFRARMIVLCVVAVYGMLASLTYGGVLLYQYHAPSSARSSPTSSSDSHTAGRASVAATRRRLWLVRRVDGYICMNVHVLLPVGGFLASASMLLYTYLHYIVFYHHRLLGVATSFRPFAWIPMVMQGILVSCAAFQAYTVVVQRSKSVRTPSAYEQGGDDEKAGIVTRFRRRLRIPGPRTFNAIIYTLAFVIFGSMLASDIAFAVSWRTLWTTFSTLRATLIEAEASWTPGSPPDLATLLELAELRSRAEQQLTSATPRIKAVILVLIVNALIMAVLNMGCGALFLLIRKQIRESVALHSRTLFNYQLASPPIPVREHAPGVPDFLGPIDPVSKPPKFKTQRSSSSGAVGPKDTVAVAINLPSPKLDDDDTEVDDAALAAAAKNRSRKMSMPSILLPRSPRPCQKEHVNGGRRKSAGVGSVVDFASPSPKVIDLAASDSLSDLKRAEVELVVVMLAIGSLALMFAGFNVWNYLWAYARPPEVIRWRDQEASYFFVDWAYCILYSFSTTALILNSLLAIRRRRVNRRRASSSATIGMRRESAMWSAGMRRHSSNAAAYGHGGGGDTGLGSRSRFGSAAEVCVVVERTTIVDRHVPGSPTVASRPRLGAYCSEVPRDDDLSGQK